MKYSKKVHRNMARDKQINSFLYTCMYMCVYMHICIYICMCVALMNMRIHVAMSDVEVVGTGLYRSIKRWVAACVALVHVVLEEIIWKHVQRHINITTCMYVYTCIYIFMYVYMYMHICCADECGGDW